MTADESTTIRSLAADLSCPPDVVINACHAVGIAEATPATLLTPAERGRVIDQLRPRPLRPGRQVSGHDGRTYTVRDILAEGSSGRVWLADGVPGEGQVALKELFAGHSSQPQDRKNARQQAHLEYERSRNRGPAIVQSLDYSPDLYTSPAFVVQELLVGSTLLEQVTSRGPLDPHDFGLLLQSLGVALEWMAARGGPRGLRVVHGDIAPQNILFTGTRYVLIDLGPGPANPRGLPLIIDATYPTPEILRGHLPVDPIYVAVFQVGLVILFAVTGRHPITPQERTLDDLRNVITHIPATMDPELQDLLRRMLTYDPIARSTAADVSDIATTLKNKGPRPVPESPPQPENSITDPIYEPVVLPETTGFRYRDQFDDLYDMVTFVPGTTTITDAPGMGKTVAAITIARRLQEEGWRIVVIVTGNDPTTMNTTLAAVADLIIPGADDWRQRLAHALATYPESERTLIIYDDVPNSDAFPPGLNPYRGAGDYRAIVTSTNTELADHARQANSNVFHIGGYSLPEALAYLEDRTGPAYTEPVAREIEAFLHGHPLGLAQAAAAITQLTEQAEDPSRVMAIYVAQLRAASDDTSVEGYRHSNLAGALRVNINQVLQKTSKDAVWKVLGTTAVLGGPTGVNQARLSQDEPDEDALDDAGELLVKASLLTTTDSAYLMHGLIARYVLEELPAEYRSAVAELAVNTVNRGVASLPANKIRPQDSVMKTFGRRLHVSDVAANLARLCTSELLTTQQRADLVEHQRTALVALIEAGHHTQAADFAEQAVTDTTTFLGPHHDITLAMRDRQAIALRLTGHAQAAINMSRENLDLYLQAKGPDDRVTLQIRNNLGSALRTAGQLDEARSIYQENARERRRVLGAADADYGASVNNLAVVLGQLGIPDAAVVLLEEAIEVATRDGHAYEETLSMRSNYCHALFQSGRTQEGLDTLRQLIREAEGPLTAGDSHPKFLMMKLREAEMVATQNLDDAHDLFKKVIGPNDNRDNYSRVLGATHLDTIDAKLLHTQTVLIPRGTPADLDQARTYLREAETSLPSSHPTLIAFTWAIQK